MVYTILQKGNNNVISLFGVFLGYILKFIA